MEDGKFWYGTDELWTWLRADGTWPMAHDRHGLFDKSFWCRQGYDWTTETTPRLRVTGHYHGRSLRLVVRVLRWQP